MLISIRKTTPLVWGYRGQQTLKIYWCIYRFSFCTWCVHTIVLYIYTAEALLADVFSVQNPCPWAHRWKTSLLTDWHRRKLGRVTGSQPFLPSMKVFEATKHQGFILPRWYHEDLMLVTGRQSKKVSPSWRETKRRHRQPRDPVLGPEGEWGLVGHAGRECLRKVAFVIAEAIQKSLAFRNSQTLQTEFFASALHNGS